MDADDLPRGWRSGAVALAGAALLAIAAVLPWVASGDATHAGVADAVLDGYVTFLVGIVAAVLIVGLEWSRAARAAAGVAGAVGLALAAYWSLQAGGAGLDRAVGLYVTALAGLLLLGGALYGERQARAVRDRRADPEPAAESGDLS